MVACQAEPEPTHLDYSFLIAHRLSSDVDFFRKLPLEKFP
jgi:hypothetical protein